MKGFRLEGRYLVMITLAVAALLLVACSSPPPEETPTPEPEAPTSAPAATTAPAAPTNTPVPEPTDTPSPTATPRPTDTPAPTNTPTPAPTIDLEAARSNVPPQIFVGTAKIDGELAPPGTIVAVLIGETEVALGVVEDNGVYTPLKVAFLGQTVTFTVKGFPATQTARTEQGGGQILNLTASSN